MCPDFAIVSNFKTTAIDFTCSSGCFYASDYEFPGTAWKDREEGLYCKVYEYDDLDYTTVYEYDDLDCTTLSAYELFGEHVTCSCDCNTMIDVQSPSMATTTLSYLAQALVTIIVGMSLAFRCGESSIRS